MKEDSSLKTEEEVTWFNSEQAAEYLKISVKTLHNLTCFGKLTYYKFGRRNRYKLEDLRKLLEDHRISGGYDEY